jgi:two-component system LytT family sensor kinase
VRAQETLLTPEQFLLTTLLVQLAVVGAVATMLVRYHRFRRLLLTERRDWPERFVFILAFGLPFTAGVVARLLLRYDALDVSLAGPFIAGLIAGPYAGAILGALMGLPAMLAGEFIALPFAVGCGFAGGGMKQVCPKDVVWQFSPFVFLDLHRYAWGVVRRLKFEWQVMLIGATIGLELLRQALGWRYGVHRLFYLGDGTPAMTSLVVLTTVLSVAIPIKIWNSARIEHKLQEQEQLLLAARVQALASQINPHFIFNTLASIASLTRSQPDVARTVILKLAALLRRLLRSQDHFVSLGDELEAVDQYLDIECVRFGDRLTVNKRIAPETMSLLVPNMILQPIVENALKHGLGGKLGGGELTLQSRLESGRAVIEVIDNGRGMSRGLEELEKSGGIGLRNVKERLNVIYGENYRLQLSSAPDRGTRVRLEIPDVAVHERITAQP